jgi:hypothetical protein
MERLARYGKETAMGGAVLLWVLGAPTAAQAAPVTATFQGSFCVHCNCPGISPAHEIVQLFFGGHDSDGGGFLNSPEATVTGVPPGNSTPCFSFCADICSADACETWTLSLDGYSLCLGPEHTGNGCGNTTCFAPGDFTFVPQDPPTVTTHQTFTFKNPDPITVTNGVVSSFTVPAAATPEVNTANLDSPLALALATLLVLSDPRRKKQND